MLAEGHGERAKLGPLLAIVFYSGIILLAGLTLFAHFRNSTVDGLDPILKRLNERTE